MAGKVQPLWCILHSSGSAPQHPTHSSFPRSWITPGAFLWLLSDEALGVEKQNQTKSQPKPSPQDRHSAALAPGRGSRRLLLLSAHGQKGSAELFLAPTLQNKKQLQAIVCFLSIFSPPCLFSQICPPGAGAEGLFGEEGAQSPSTAWGHSSHHPGAVPGALRDRGCRAAEPSCSCFQNSTGGWCLTQPGKSAPVPALPPQAAAGGGAQVKVTCGLEWESSRGRHLPPGASRCC